MTVNFGLCDVICVFCFPLECEQLTEHFLKLGLSLHYISNNGIKDTLGHLLIHLTHGSIYPDASQTRISLLRKLAKKKQNFSTYTPQSICNYCRFIRTLEVTYSNYN